jgi:hypothetical protein
MTSVTVAGRQDRGRWRRRTLGVAAIVAVACTVPDTQLMAVAAVLLAASAVTPAAGRLLRGMGWPSVVAVALPAGERDDWRVEVWAVLHAAPDARERRRQARGFLLGLPAVAATAWYLSLRARG